MRESIVTHKKKVRIIFFLYCFRLHISFFNIFLIYWLSRCFNNLQQNLDLGVFQSNIFSYSRIVLTVVLGWDSDTTCLKSGYFVWLSCSINGCRQWWSSSIYGPFISFLIQELIIKLNSCMQNLKGNIFPCETACAYVPIQGEMWVGFVTTLRLGLRWLPLSRKLFRSLFYPPNQQQNIPSNGIMALLPFSL